MRQTSPRLPPKDDLVNAFEFEEAAKLKLSAAVYSTIAGSDRTAFDRMTFRPRLNVPTTDMDLSVELFGSPLFTPIVVGPISDQRQYHPDGELAMVRGAAAANAAVMISSRSSVSISQIAEAAKTPLWYAVYADAVAQQKIQPALAAGCKVLCIARPNTAPRVDWKTIDQLRTGVTVPVLIKGITTAEDAKAAVQRGIQGIVVSTYGAAAKPSSIESLPAIVEAAADKTAVLIDGSFRRGSDIVKALIFGAKAVLIARPAAWGLASYGADGVQTVIELLQNDVARTMGMLGAPNLKALHRTMVKVHTR
jgi:isopentenyl diphosphate isomerase/L-lactate dehydrogenase-like FMN-dependent dehydrogenase